MLEKISYRRKGLLGEAKANPETSYEKRQRKLSEAK